MEDDTSDILGTHKVPIVRGSPSGRLSSLSFPIKAAFIFAALLALYVVGRRLWEILLVWREKSYKLSMRRRHGIPDNDHRPFNVAYAAVMRARQESEAAKRKARLEEVAPGQDHRSALPDQNLRQRVAIVGGQGNVQTAWPSLAADSLHGGLNPSTGDVPRSTGDALNGAYAMATNPLNFTNRYIPNPAGLTADIEPDYSPPRAGPSRRVSRKNIISDDEGRKRAFDEEEFEEPDHPKKSRVEGEELIDGDEDPEWEEYRQIPKRGSKRVLGDEDETEDTFLSKRARDKRARKFSLEKVPLYQSDDMEIDDNEIDDNEADDEVAELKYISRGKKRDRAEAGSTFGGDDEDSVHEAEIEDDVKARRRRRKRRTVGKRKSDAGSSLRGQKRDRDVEEGDSEVESLDGELQKVSRKKRGKRSAHASLQDGEEKREGSDLSMDESQASSSKGRGRRIGDEWENNGVMFKIGPNGQRLRQALVKKARQKFNMPVDSQHPDREANLEVCVETWLTEDEFKEAKAQRLLAWQDSPKASTEPESPSVEVKDPPSPPPAGKNLLWRSRSAAPSPLSHLPAQSTPPSRQADPYRQSIATNVGLRLNPFREGAVSGKRIASGARVASVFSGHGISSNSASPGLTDSTNGGLRNGHKAFSKWEKQDLEAKAMMKMRESNMKKQAEKEEREKQEREKVEKEKKDKEAAAAAAAVKPIPTITITTPAEVKPPQVEAKPPTLSFAPPSTSSQPAKDAASKPTSFFGPPPGASAPPFTLGNATPLKAEDKPSAKPVTPQPTFFANPSSGLPAKPAAPLFGVTTDKSQQPKPQSAFSFTAPAKPANASTAGNAGRPVFSLGATPPQPPQLSATEGQKDGQATTGASGGALLSRMGPPAHSAAQSQQPSTSPFNKPPASEAQKPLSVFGNTTVQATPATTATSTGATSKPKFDFGMSNKPLGSTSAPPASTSSLSGALGNNNAKPASTSLSFNFKAPTAPAAATNGMTTGTSGTSTGTTATQFSPAAPSSGPTAGETNPFGGSQTLAPAAAPQSNEAQTNPPAFGTTTSLAPAFGANPFGGNMNSAPQAGEVQTKLSPFGASGSSSTSAFGTLGGTKASTPPAVSQSNESQNKSSVFGTTNSSTASPFSSFGVSKAPQSNDAAPKSAFSGFGNGTQGTSTHPFGSNTGSGAGSTVFGGGGPSNAFGNTGGAAKSAEAPNGKFFWSTTPSPALNTASTGEATKPPFSFGGQPATAAPTNGFSGFKFGDNVKPSTTPTASPQAPQPPTGQPIFGSTPVGTTPSAFGFGAPTATNTTGAGGGFSFSNTTSTEQQQQ